jgi:putative DNA primase/helicase
MTAAQIAAALGGKREGPEWRCPCPVHGGHSLLLADGRNGRLLATCFGGGCSWNGIYTSLREQGLIDGGRFEINPERQHQLRSQKEVETRAAVERLRRGICAARALYRRARSAAGTPVGVYLSSRGILGPILTVLRFLERCPHRNGRYYPAMLAPIVNVDGHQIAVHKTFLSPEGDKVDLPKDEQRETRGPMLGGAVRLERHEQDRELIVGEGIESTASAMRIFSLPGWAAICANGIETLDLPDAVRRIVIAADHDAIGLRAALLAQERWTAEGRSVRILRPPNPGEDFNDVLLRG